MKLSRQYLWLYLLLLLWIWASALVRISGWPQLWGMIPLGPGSAPWVLAAAVLCTMVLFGRGKTLFARLDGKITAISRYTSPSRARLLSAGFFCLLAISVSWVFRSRNHFMGDGWKFIEYVAKPFLFYENDPLDFFVHQLLHRLLQILGVSNPEMPYAVLHCLLLPLFLWVCWRIACLVAADRGERIVLTALTAATAGLQLFFGYVESYTLLHLLIVFYLFSGVRYFRGNRETAFPLAPTLIMLLAVATHRCGLTLGPSLLFLWLVSLKNRKIFKLKPVAIPSIGVMAGWLLAMAAALIFFENNPMIPLKKPLVETDVPYLLFDPEHFSDQLNFFLLICPSAAFGLLAAVFKWRDISKKAEPAYIFLIWAAAGTAFFSFTYNPIIGIRDWDLLSLPAIPLSLLGGWSLILLLGPDSRRESFLRALALAAVVHAAAWIRVNADMSRGVEFLGRVREVDYHKHCGKLGLGLVLQERGFYREAVRQYRLVEDEQSIRAQNNMGVCFLALGMPDSALYYYRDFMERVAPGTPDSRKIYLNMSLAYDTKGKTIEASDIYLKMRSRGLDFDDWERRDWLQNADKLSDKFKKRLQRNPTDVGALLFFLRYQTIAKNADIAEELFAFIMKQELSIENWLHLLRFAEVCGYDSSFRAMSETAGRQHTGIEKKYSAFKTEF